MRVNLDQIEFYNGPSQPPCNNRRKSPPTHIPQTFQHFSSTEIVPGPPQANSRKDRPSSGTAYLWNTFDFEIDRLYGVTEHRTTKDTESSIAPIIPATLDIQSDNRGSCLASSEPVLFEDTSATPIPCRPDQLDHVSLDLQENGLPNFVSYSKGAEIAEYLRAPCVTAPASRQAGNATSSLSTTYDCHRESVQESSSITRALSEYSGPINGGMITNQSQSPELSDVLCTSAIDASGRAVSSSRAEAKSDTSGLSSRSNCSNQCPSPENSGARTTRVYNGPLRYPSVAVVVPAPSWKQRRATRASTRAAAAACNKRLRSGQASINRNSPDAFSRRTEGSISKMKKTRTPALRRVSRPSEGSIPASCHCTRDIHGIRGNALLTVVSDSGVKPAYYFTFVPDTSSASHQAHPGGVSGKQRPYTSDENALLVRLKEREAMSWVEIADYFPDRTVSSLQVHYSTKLRHKARD
ncbi:uncharacterized protein BO97DRAFT_416938 [Aspergillus homomorphus CBS 101889]|uniref:Myb-like domain-containing protein n=1 Tax=Aspergillus homomorphus (strain CBS 101889) TaxID=1450537 RepID=A0A395HNX1_ASPHC|nr:hypothetical protein BO97DRAFT_416938 [Aspergillus homomorphus CBS 101889]RAL09460.1 hypothetical protein BO97DRAFT_416938 [Aspergillus homomorphus CBS 101889]